MTISNSNKEIAKVLFSAFGSKPDVNRFWDENERSHVDILVCNDRPNEGFLSIGTIGLSDYPLFKDGHEYPVRLELVAKL